MGHPRSIHRSTLAASLLTVCFVVVDYLPILLLCLHQAHVVPATIQRVCHFVSRRRRLTLLTASLVQQNAPSHGLVLLVPLVLGIGTVNPAYFDQLLQSLEWPQSLGVVGGRPGSSLYFVGHQGQQLLYLDPHTVQEVCGFGSKRVFACCCVVGLVLNSAVVTRSCSGDRRGQHGDTCGQCTHAVNAVFQPLYNSTYTHIVW